MPTKASDLYTRVTQQIIDAIQAGAGSCRMPWHFQPAEAALPTNPVTQKTYRGVNVLALWVQRLTREYPTALWATYQQWLATGAQVRKRERGTLIVLWKPTGTEEVEPIDDQQEERRRRGLLVRGYTVFNAAQVDSYEPETAPLLSPETRIAEAERFFFALGADIRHGGNEAYYQPASDHIQLPPYTSFVEPLAYYSILAHELTHWTGGACRLGRNLAGRFGSMSYAAEELVAELGAAFLLAQLRLTLYPRTDHAAYLAPWLSLLTRDPKAIFTAASKAQEAADFLTTRQANTETSAA